MPDAHPPGFPSVRILERTVLYPIRGDSVREIRSQLEHHGPWPAGEGQGRTDGAFEVGTELEPGADGCRLAGLELRVRITTTLPEWQPGPRAPVALQAHWEAALEQLVRHEDGHRLHAIEAAHQLHHQLLRIPPQDSCMRIQRKVDDALRSMSSALRMRGWHYDQRTGNGLRQPPAAP